MIWNYFDRAYVINQDMDTERLERVRRRLGDHGISYSRMPGCLPPPARKGQKLPNGYVGCALSHLACVQLASADHLRNVLIFEDDCMLRDDASEIMERVVAELQSVPWDVLYLGWSVVGETRPASTHLRAHDEGYHAHAYAVNHTGFSDVARACNATYDNRLNPQDVELTRLPGIRKLHVVPLLAIQEVGHSVAADRAGDYLGVYAACADLKDFVAHCAEARQLGYGARIAT